MAPFLWERAFKTFVSVWGPEMKALTRQVTGQYGVEYGLCSEPQVLRLCLPRILCILFANDT